ncbi:MAG: hypothetical protein RRY53_04365, partial [Pseudoflavonifractor sp.]
MKQLRTRFLSGFLVLTMVLSLLPVGVAAEPAAAAGDPPPVEAQLPAEQVPAVPPTAAPVPEPLPLPCAKTPGCTLTEGHEGGCVMAAQPPAEEVQPQPAVMELAADIAPMAAIGGTGEELTPYLMTEAAQIYALARILTKAPANDSDAVLTPELK